MYDNYDADELRNALETAKAAKRSLINAIDDLAELGAITAQDSAEDALRALEEEIEELDKLVCRANAEEAREELYDYFEAVGL